MDHPELLNKMREELHHVKDEIIGKLDDYQHRVTKLETEQGWIRRAVLAIMGTLVALSLYYIKVDMSDKIRQQNKQEIQNDAR